GRMDVCSRALPAEPVRLWRQQHRAGAGVAMLSARVLARYHRLTPLPDGVDPAKLGPELHTVCGQPFRRTDRFTRLALLGSAHCVAGQQLAASCGVYLGSFTGPLESNIRVQQQLLAERELPRPFDFVNTLGSVACFHVAQNLSL